MTKLLLKKYPIGFVVKGRKKEKLTLFRFRKKIKKFIVDVIE